MRYVTVTATVKDADRVTRGTLTSSYPAEFLPLSTEWKKTYSKVAMEETGHYRRTGDGWRVAFALSEEWEG